MSTTEGLYTTDQQRALDAATACFTAWGGGKFRGDLAFDEWKANSLELFVESGTVDWSGPAAPVFASYPATSPEAHRFLAFWDTFVFADMVPSLFPGPVGSNVAYCNLRSNLTRGDDKMVSDELFRFTVNEEGKITGMKVLWGNCKLFDETFGKTFTLEPETYIVDGVVVKNVEVIVEPRKKKGLLCCAK